MTNIEENTWEAETPRTELESVLHNLITQLAVYRGLVGRTTATNSKLNTSLIKMGDPADCMDKDVEESQLIPQLNYRVAELTSLNATLESEVKVLEQYI